MADMKEKLVELLNEMQDSGIIETPAGFGFTKQYIENGRVASHLIANGVTVQEWISVKDRLPEYGRYLCNVKSMAFRGASYQAILKYENGGFIEDGIYTDFVTHWMPLPEPPKEE